MMRLDPDRMAAEIEGDFVISTDGTRLNELQAIPQWLRAGRKLARVFDRLADDPDSGFLGYQPAFTGLRTGAAIQYWHSLEDLKRSASDPDDLPVPARKWYDEEVDERRLGLSERGTASEAEDARASHGGDRDR